MSRWQDVWSRAIAAATDPTRLPPGVLACAVGEQHAAVLSLSAADDALQLVLLARRDGRFLPWGEPVIEPLLPSSSPESTDLSGHLQRTVGPVKIAEKNRAIWAFGGELAESSDAIVMQVGQQRTTSTVSKGYFVVIASDVPSEAYEVEISPCGSAGRAKAGAWAIRLGPAVEITES